MKETSTTILEWAFNTFGRSDPLTILLRANEEISELLIAYQYLSVGDIGDLEEVLEGLRTECADVVVMVSQVNELLGLTLNEKTFRYVGEHGYQTHPEFFREVTQYTHAFISGLAAITYNPNLATDQAKNNLAEIGKDLCLTVAVLYDRISWGHGGIWSRVEHKMEINRNRSWVRREDGAFQHEEK